MFTRTPLALSAVVFALLAASPAPAAAQVDCWAPMFEEDAVGKPAFAPLRRTLLAIEQIVRRNAAFVQPPEPVRMRTIISAGPFADSGARIRINAYPPKQTTANIQLWTGTCDVIPQADRVNGGIGQVAVFVNYSVTDRFLSSGVPKRTGTVAGYPEYNDWVVITKEGRLPWIPVTLRDKLDEEGRRREKQLAEWTEEKRRLKAPEEKTVQSTYAMLKKTDPAGAENYLTSMRDLAEDIRKRQQLDPAWDEQYRKEIDDLRQYRASFSADELDAPAVWGDPSGDGRRRLEARIAELQRLTPGDQQLADAWAGEARQLERSAQAAARAGNQPEAARLREQANALAMKARDLKRDHLERVQPSIRGAMARHDLTNLTPGDGARAMAFKPDPAFPDPKDPNRIQVITVGFFFKINPTGATPRNTWATRTKETFDYAALARLLE